ncbi:MAG: CoA ester lyase [Zoogloeaceae bacterium]|jgi:citrate lyase subunit beta/citryl-CoA lyase|nr:CoA ester lyase [Zoogloeaceae bacterium]
MPGILPDEVLFGQEKALPALPAVDHYAGSAPRIEKSLALQGEMGEEAGEAVFDLTCDCEDGARAGGEKEHALMCAQAVTGTGNRFGRVGVRIHDVRHACWEQDLDILLAAAGPRLAFITLPKARSVEDVRRQIAFLRHSEGIYRLERAIPVHVLIETHGALRDVWRIAALPGVESLDFGLMDFVSDHRGAIPGYAMQSPGQFSHPLIVRAKCEIAAAAHAFARIPAHNVSTELHDAEIIARDARQARLDFGYLRMWSIHPAQIRPILEAMRPDFSEVETAAGILVAAQDADWGPTRQAGKLHDRASYRYYWELLQRARATGMALPEEIRRRFWKN